MTRRLTREDLDLIELECIRKSRKSFYAYRQYMSGFKLKTGWFVREVSKEIQQFYEDYKSGKRPILVIQAPPQHGKSEAVTDGVSWIAGQNPALRFIYASFSERLGIRANLKLQRMITRDKYQSIFPRTKINDRRTVTSVGYQRNKEMIEFIDTGGSFRNTTVRGSITGETLDIGIIDDPIKGREEANSTTIRDKTWNWFTDDFMTRFDELGGLLIILTRWHIDDPVGRLINTNPNVKVLSYKAIAEEDEEHRSEGEALFPEHKSIDFLLSRKTNMPETNWQSLYQQNPMIPGGGIFPVKQFRMMDHAPVKSDIDSSCRYWDKAGTAGGGDYTAGTLMHKLKDGRFVIEDVQRGQWSALDRENTIKHTAEVDGKDIKIGIEQEPGSGGKESAESTIRNLAGFNVEADKVSGSKEIRADGYAAQVQGGNVYLVRAPWNRQFIDEHEAFPNGTHDDVVDSCCGAFNKLVSGSKDFFDVEWE